MAEDGAMPEQIPTYKSLEELKLIDPEFDFSKTYIYYGGRKNYFRMIFVEKLNEPLELDYKLDGNKAFDERAKFQIVYRRFGEKNIEKITGWLYTTEGKALADMDNVLSQQSVVFKKIEEKDILYFMNEKKIKSQK